MASEREPLAVSERAISLSEKAYRLLRQKILHGDIAPGSKLKIEVLQRECALSSSPLREALNRLAGERLVFTDENRGFRAAPMSPLDLKDITTLRLVVEPAALAESIDAANDEWEARIVAAFHRLERVEARVPRAQHHFDADWTERHKNFHMALISGCSSDRMFSLCSGLFDQAERYRRFSAINRKRPRDTAREHRSLMEAALAKNAAEATDLLREHVKKTSDNVLALQSGQKDSAAVAEEPARRSASKAPSAT
jgi:GntR family carbon starvation induced transcriptional regulator